jgi:hypothetical protein
MRKISPFILSLMVFFFYSNQVMAEEYNKSNLFSLWVDMGRTVSNDDGLDEGPGGKASYNLRFEHCFTRSYFSPSLGFRLGKLPLRGSYDWNWTDGVIYLKVEIDRGLLTPYVKAGMGLYYLNLKFPAYIDRPNVSKGYLGYNMGFGFELIFRKWPLFLFTELDYNIITISPSIRLPMFREVSSAKIINPTIGLGFSF